MIERHFVMNLDRISGERNAEHPGKKQEIIKGKAFMHFYDPEAADVPGTFNSMLVLAIERSYLQELYAQLMTEHDPKNPKDAADTLLQATASLDDLMEDNYYDPDNIYAAIVVTG